MFDPRARPTRLIACRCIGKFLFISEFGATDCPFGRSSVHFTSQPRLVFREHLAAAQGKTEMEQIALYKGFRIRVYEDWSGLWLAETKKPFARRPGAGDHEDTDAEYIATPSGHPTPEAAINFIKQMIDSPALR